MKDHLFVCAHEGFKHESDSGVHLGDVWEWDVYEGGRCAIFAGSALLHKC